MKIFKRIICGISTLAMCLAITPLSASAAATYWTGDVNGDGTVDMLDVTCMQRYLTGKSGANGTTCERLDVNQNYIIDKNDKDALLSIIIHTSSSQQKTYQNTTMTATNLQKTYRKFDAQSGAKIGSDYILYPVNNIASTSASTYSIIGNDNREVDYSKSGVVTLSSGDGDAFGTGFIVDNHTILTAAHCLFDIENKVACKDLKYTLYDSSSTQNNVISTTYNAEDYHIPVDYINNNMHVENDYALITVSENLNAYRCFDLGVCRDGLINLEPDIFVTGYSGKNIAGVNSSLLGHIVTGSGKFTANWNGEKITPYILNYNTDMVGGESGGPVYINSNGNMTVIGINTYEAGSFNFGRRIDTTVLNFIYNNSNL